MLGLISTIPASVKKWLSYILLIGGFVVVVWFLLQKVDKLTAENERQNNVIKNINFEKEVTKAKNGELIYSVNALTVKGEELKFLNNKLYGDIDNMNLKMKNLQGITSLEYKYETCYDTVYLAHRLNKLKYEINKIDGYNSLKGYVNLPESLFSQDSLIANNKKSWPFLSEVKYDFKDTLLMVPEWQYKRSWIFFKKLTGVKMHVKSESPNFKFEQMQTFQITK